MGICDKRVVIVTGAGGGLGAAHARVLAGEGAAVLANDINTDAAQAVVDDILAAGGRAVVNQSDITNYESSGEAIAQAIPEDATSTVNSRPTGLPDRFTTSPKPMVATVMKVMYTQSSSEALNSLTAQ